MNNKRFALGIVGTVCFLTFSIWLAAWILPETHYMYGEYGEWMQQRDYLKKHHEDNPLLLLGDSRIKIDVNPQELGVNAHSLAMTGSTPLEAYYSLIQYLEHNDNPPAVVIGFAPTHLMHMENYDKRDLYYHFYDKKTTTEINDTIVRFGGKDYNAEAWMYDYRVPLIYMHGIVKSIGKGNTKKNEQTYQEVERLSGGMILKGTHPADKEVCPEETTDPGFTALGVLDYYLCKTIELCQERHIPVQIIQLPMSAYGLQRIETSGFYAQYQAYMEGIKNKYNIPVETEILTFEHDEFADDSHLNATGTARFTQIVKDKILRY